MIFQSQIPYSTLHQLLKTYDVFLHPSCHSRQGDCEGGAPIVLLDAQATGLPIISTRHCDIPNIVADQVCGILCDENSISNLSFAIERFYKMNSEEYRSFSENARLAVEANHRIQDCSRKLCLLYRTVIDNFSTKAGVLP